MIERISTVSPSRADIRLRPQLEKAMLPREKAARPVGTGHSLSAEEILGLPLRQTILSIVKEQRGITISELAKQVKLSQPAVSHHVELLERIKVIQSVKVGNGRHLYPGGEKIPDLPPKVMQGPEGQILTLVRERGEISRGEIAELTHIPARAVRYYVGKLVKSGLVARRKEGQETLVLPIWQKSAAHVQHPQVSQTGNPSKILR